MKKILLICIFIFINLVNLHAQNRIAYNYKISCLAANNPNIYMDSICHNPALFIREFSNNCVFKLLDTLTSTVIEKNDTVALFALDKLYGVSDGDIKEYFLDVGIKMFYSNFSTVIQYCSENSNRKTNNIENMIIDAVSMDMSNSPRKTDSVKAFIKRQEKTNKFYQKQKTYISLLEKKFDPNKFN